MIFSMFIVKLCQNYDFKYQNLGFQVNFSQNCDFFNVYSRNLSKLWFLRSTFGFWGKFQSKLWFFKHKNVVTRSTLVKNLNFFHVYGQNLIKLLFRRSNLSLFSYFIICMSTFWCFNVKIYQHFDFLVVEITIFQFLEGSKVEMFPNFSF